MQLEIVILRGKLSVLRSKISFYGKPLAICDYKTDELPPQMKIFIAVIPILIHSLPFLPFKVYYFAPTASAPSNVKQDTSQSEGVFHNVVGLATVYRRLYCRKFDVIQ